MKHNYTAISVVLDASGSMASLQRDTLGSFNQFLDDQKSFPGEASFSLCTFNTSVTTVHDFAPLHSVAQLTAHQYHCSGGTSLLDAMGFAIDNLGAKLASLPEENRPDKVIMVVLTDGEENSSSKYSARAGGLAKIKDKIQHQQSVYSWQFIFLGANIDAISVGDSLGVTRGMSFNYMPTAAGTSQTYGALSSSVSSYRRSGIVETSGLASLVPGASPIVDVAGPAIVHPVDDVDDVLGNPMDKTTLSTDPAQAMADLQKHVKGSRKTRGHK
jgi:uncharacterized protein YegL